MKKVFIDGQEGTTGLQIYERLVGRDDIELLEIPHEKRKDQKLKSEFLNNANLVILCLPDQAAIDSVALVNNPETKIIDASTAFRTNPEWTYGLPEVNASQRDKIIGSKRVSNPGCYPTGVILSLAPLVSSEILDKEAMVSVNAVSGFSGGGKKLIALYEGSYKKQTEHYSVRPYALGKIHKHIDEMHLMTGLKKTPVFLPSVGNFYNGMLITIPLFKEHLNKDASSIHSLLKIHYKDEQFVEVKDLNSDEYLEDGFLSATSLNGTNKVEIFVFDHDNAVLVLSRLDNLGKGASGAAVQNMNLMLELNESTSLT
ncbi:MAG: N-acetyl-gamma-glutamyl-phosphate reductase [Deltaproteobacteria bacterium]|nr:N-acetyl-gamma-glutamyl-phosphate reductase [Deltaproteobacteria bacterium]